jgi:hypothetical protein
VAIFTLPHRFIARKIPLVPTEIAPELISTFWKSKTDLDVPGIKPESLH